LVETLKHRAAQFKTMASTAGNEDLESDSIDVHDHINAFAGLGRVLPKGGKHSGRGKGTRPAESGGGRMIAGKEIEAELYDHLNRCVDMINGMTAIIETYIMYADELPISRQAPVLIGTLERLIMQISELSMEFQPADECISEIVARLKQARGPRRQRMLRHERANDASNGTSHHTGGTNDGT
jgi:hypothetical protein